MHKQAGIALVELMIALAITMLISIVLLKIYLATNNNLIFIAVTNKWQQQAQTAIRTIKQELLTAGFVGCNSLRNSKFKLINHVNNHTSLNIDNRIQILNANDGAELAKLKIKQQQLLPDSQILLIRKLDDAATFLTKDMHSKSANIYTSSSSKIKAEDIVLIADCEQAEIIKTRKTITKNSNLIVSLDKAKNGKAILTRAYDKNTLIGKYKQMIFFVAATGRKNKKQNEIYALYKKQMHEPSQEIIDSVASFKLFPITRIDNLHENNKSQQHITAINLQLQLDNNIENGFTEKIWNMIATVRN